ncbi:MAG: hypothetical protein RMY16_08475 [Nostoc sp. DedQUE12b]|uniref:hypothetical protein n=1 Tax=Nostoc sp. DedQUE12b TaxID=3075398 RepID=UPI002AD2F926|nr:hypothetical protein [Nostoc sp. DedQUE12b]MDZ8085617.1 hypothetical protein [Nostoc sp. DedQUE12b]
MAEVCKDIDAGLAALNRKIDAQNQRIRELERKQQQCCEGHQEDGSVDLSGILKRLKKAETDILELGGVLKTVIDDVKDLLDAATEHTETANQSQNIFSAIIDFFVDE